MNFKSINESFSRLFESINPKIPDTEHKTIDIDESMINQLKEALNKLNESTITPEDQHDSDLIRSMLDKMQGRANAKFSPEEIAILDKYGIKRNNYARNIYIGDRPLDREVDSASRVANYTTIPNNNYSNGTKSKINYADRARKLPQRAPNQAFTQPWSVDNDAINAHGRRLTQLDNLQDAERYAQEIPMRDKIQHMKDALRSREYYQGQIDGADAEREAAIAKAKKTYDDQVASAEKTYKWHTTDAAKSRDRYQTEIDKLLKRDKKEESLNKSTGGKWTEKAFEIVNNLDNTTELKDILKKLLKDMPDKDVGEFLHQRGYIEYKK